LRAAESTKGLSLAVFVMVFMRCFTEAPFSAATLFNGDILTQVLLLRIALYGAGINEKQRRHGFFESSSSAGFALRS